MYTDFKFENNNLMENIESYYENFDMNSVYEHTLDVVYKISMMKNLEDEIREQCITAALLHDLGRVVKRGDFGNRGNEIQLDLEKKSIKWFKANNYLEG